MNITFNSDREVDVTGVMVFTDKKTYVFQLRLAGHGPATHTIIGRWPKDIVSLELQYDGHRFLYPIIVEGDSLKTINLYGGRDYWSQLLRNAALKETGPTDPDDIKWLENADD